MGDFFIRFIRTEREQNEIFQIGEIRIGDFVETFRSSLSYWNADDYLRQWKEGLSRLLSGNECSCIVTSMYDPSVANFIFWWILYLEKEIVHIQNNILFFDELDRPFFVDKLYKNIPKREVFDKDGNKISEWDIGIEEIRNFYIVL